MDTTPLGPGLPSVSAVGFGGMPLSTTGRPDPATALGVIHAALDAGVTLIDTADVYCLDHRDIGHNERLVSKALATWPGPTDHVIVATKGGMIRPHGSWERDGRPEHLRAACENSLKALGRDRIDLYQLHAPDPYVEFEDSVGELVELQRQGKIRWIGLSNVSVDQIRHARGIGEIATVQNRLNPFFREAIESGVVAHCASEGLGFLAYSPVGGGRLNKKLPDHPALQPIAEAHGATPHEVVIAWVRAQGVTVIPIPGARTEPHVRSSARSAELDLSQDEIRAINDAEFSRA